MEAREYDLTEGSITKKLLWFFFPIMIGTLFQQLYNTVDTVVVGNFVGTTALAAVGGSTAQIINLMVGFFVGLASGAMVVISQCFGAGEKDSLQKTVHTAIAFSILAGVFLTAVGEVFAPWALRTLGTPEDTIAESLEYLRIYFIGTVPLLLFNVGSGILRAVGDSKRPLYYLIVCCVLNIILDIIFVTVFQWGVRGVAWATTISLYISAGLIMWNLCTTDALYRVIFRKIRITKEPLKRMLIIGIPTGLQSMLFALSNTIIQTIVNGFGSKVVAAWSTSGKWDGIFWSVSNSFGATITAFTGQCFGAGKYDRMRASVKKCMLIALGTSVVFSVLILTFSRFGVQLFSNDQEVNDYAVRMLFCFVPYYCIWTLIEILAGALHGAGDAVRPTIIVLSGTCVLRVIWCYCIMPHWNTLESICYCYPITWLITAVAFVIYYKKSHWLERCIQAAKK